MSLLAPSARRRAYVVWSGDMPVLSSESKRLNRLARFLVYPIEGQFAWSEAELFPPLLQRGDDEIQLLALSQSKSCLPHHGEKVADALLDIL